MIQQYYRIGWIPIVIADQHLGSVLLIRLKQGLDDKFSAFLWLPYTCLSKDLAPQLYLSSVDKCLGAFITEMGNLVSLKLMNI